MPSIWFPTMSSPSQQPCPFKGNKTTHKTPSPNPSGQTSSPACLQLFWLFRALHQPFSAAQILPHVLSTTHLNTALLMPTGARVFLLSGHPCPMHTSKKKLLIPHCIQPASLTPFPMLLRERLTGALRSWHQAAAAYVGMYSLAVCRSVAKAELIPRSYTSLG